MLTIATRALCAITATLCLVAITHADTPATTTAKGPDMATLRGNPAFADCKKQAKEKTFATRDERRAFLATCVNSADAKIAPSATASTKPAPKPDTKK